MALADTTAIPGPAPGPTGVDLTAGPTVESAGAEAPVIHPCPIGAGILVIGWVAEFALWTVELVGADVLRQYVHIQTFLFAQMQANPDPNACLGVFGLSLYTTERDLKDVFSKYGPLADVCIVYDQQSRRSRGFAFVYFENTDDAKEVTEHLNQSSLQNIKFILDIKDGC